MGTLQTEAWNASTYRFRLSRYYTEWDVSRASRLCNAFSLPGPNACEIFLLLFAFFIEDPDSLVIIRGNHEDSGTR